MRTGVYGCILLITLTGVGANGCIQVYTFNYVDWCRSALSFAYVGFLTAFEDTFLVDKLGE